MSAGVLAAAIAGCATREAVRVEGAWARAAESGSTTAGYFTLVNRGPTPIVVTAAEAPVATRTEMHETYEDGGRMGMREVARLTVAAGSERRFEPGSHHLMLIELREPLNAGTTTRIVLHLEDGRTLAADALVRP